MQKAGGIAAHVASGTFVIGLLMYATLLGEFTAAEGPAAAISFLIDHESVVLAWNIVITIVFGLALVPLTLALRDRVGTGRGAGPARVGAVFGIMWATIIIAAGMVINVGYQAVTGVSAEDPAAAEGLWRAVDTVGNGLGGGNEVVGAVWVVLVSCSVWMSRALPRWIAVLGVVCGMAGLATLVPGLEEVGAVFGLGLIVWFTSAGTMMVRTSPVAVRGEAERAEVGA